MYNSITQVYKAAVVETYAVICLTVLIFKNNA